MMSAFSGLPTSPYEGNLNLANIFAMPVCVLEDGTRLISENGLQQTFGVRPQALLQKPYDEGSISDVDWAIVCGRTPYLSNGEKRFGYNTRILRVIVKTILKFDKRRKLTKAQKRRLHIVHIIRDALVDVAIDALVDECTGYQKIRSRDALEKLFEKYLQEHARKWAKTFPDVFWTKLARIKKIKNFDPNNRPKYFGHLVNDLIYSRLAPHILEQLKKVNPRMEYGERANRHHQHLTESVGLPELKEHLIIVMGLMDAFPTDWGLFKSALNRSRPKFGGNYELDIYDEFTGIADDD